mmetsp:Transcript_18601/g.43092  ORF Transcript_18601/g.43092 Transcript_18601/m.43092 type:complete len:278 (-) Transcript_18601:1905-2738(-)
MAVRNCLTALFAATVFSSCFAQDSLDGHAFDCGGLLIGFQGVDKIHCMSGGSSTECGVYAYSSDGILSGSSSLTGPFVAWDLEKRDGLLVSFQSDLGVSCNVVSLSWRTYSTQKYMGLKCPIQNENDVSFQDNHFSLGVSGDVALRSPLALTASGRRLVRDSYGVYKWFEEDDAIRLYFGPQQGQKLTVIHGKLSPDGKLYVDGYIPPGPCVHDGTSALEDVSQLPRTAASPATLDDNIQYAGAEPPSSVPVSGTGFLPVFTTGLVVICAAVLSLLL